MRRAALGLGIVLALAPARARAEVPTRDYVVRERETCLEIAVRETGDASGLAELHRLNPQLGPLPHHLRAGQVIKLPANRVVEPDAHLTDQRGPVEVRRAGDTGWAREDTGASLYRQWRVGARDRATAQVTFRDASLIAMRENTVVVIFGPAARAATVGSFKTTLETGALRTRLGELDPKKPFEVTTGGGVVGLAGGSAVVGVDRGQTTRVSNHRGQPATIARATAGARGRAIAVAPGFGSTMSKGAEPTPPRPLPPSPTWTETTALLATGWVGAGGHLHATWQPEPKATRYRLELARDPDFTAVDFAVEVDGTATAVDAEHVPPGEYFLGVAAIDADGLESAPGAARAVRVVELPLPANAAPAPGGDAIEVGLGTHLELPEHVRCGVDSAPPSADVVFATTGEVALHCEGSPIALPVRVAPVRVHERGLPARVLVGGEGDLALAFETARPFVGEVVVDAEPGVESALRDVTATGATLHVRGVRAGDHLVHLRVGTAELARVVVQVLPDPAARVRGLADPWRPDPVRGEVGPTAGVYAGGVALGLAGAYVIVPRVLAEVAGTRAIADRATLGALGIAVPLVVGPWSPRVRAGFVVRDRAGAVRGGGYAGVALAATLARHLVAVVSADAVAAVGDGGVAASASASIRFGF